MPEVPDPESLPDYMTRWEPFKDQIDDSFERARPIDTRPVQPFLGPRTAQPESDRQQVWFRADGTLPDDPNLHACVAAYATDMTILDTALLPHGISWDDNVMMASLDHALWFHRQFRADEWLLFDQISPSSSGARGLGRGEMYTRDGELVASVMQEGLIRPLD